MRPEGDALHWCTLYEQTARVGLSARGPGWRPPLPDLWCV